MESETTTVSLEQFADTRTQVLSITVDQYHRMMEEGIIEEGAPLELLDGVIIRKDRSALGEDSMTIGNHHTFCIGMLQNLTQKVRQLGSVIRIQQPISIPPANEPEPDAAIVRGSELDYGDRLPESSDILCVVEVSDASIQRDRTAKLRIYANGGIQLYFIINLQSRIIERYSDPMIGDGHYSTSATSTETDTVIFPTAKGKGITVRVRDLLLPNSKSRTPRNGQRRAR